MKNNSFEAPPIHERIRNIISQYIIPIKFKTEENKFYPEIIVLIPKEESSESSGASDSFKSFNRLRKLKNDLFRVGFRCSFKEVDKKSVSSILQEGREEIIKQINLKATNSNNTNNNTNDKANNNTYNNNNNTTYNNNSIIRWFGSRSAEELSSYLDAKNFNIKFSLFSIELQTISPKLFKQVSDPKTGRVIEKIEKIENTSKIWQIIGMIISIVLTIIGIWWVIDILTTNRFDEPAFSSFDYLFNEGDTIRINILYCMLGIIFLIIVRELCRFLAFKTKKIEFTPSWILGFDHHSDKHRLPNHQFDIGFTRIIASFIFSVLLLVVGFMLSVQKSLIELDIDYRIYSENLVKYNLLTYLIKIIFFPEPAVFGTFETYNLPVTVILMHPLAYAGYVCSLITLFSTIPLIFTDGGKIVYAATRKKYIIWIMSTLAGIAIAILIPGAFMAAFFIPFMGISLDLAKTMNIEDTQYYVHSLSRKRRIVGFLVIIVLCILLFPLSSQVNFLGFIY